MSDLIATMHRLAGLPAGLLAHRTIGGGALLDLPPLPLTSRDVTLPTPAIIRPREVDLTAGRVREFRQMVTALRKDQRSLCSWDATLIAELARWRRPPSEWEAQQVALLAERSFWATQDGAALC